MNWVRLNAEEKGTAFNLEQKCNNYMKKKYLTESILPCSEI